MHEFKTPKESVSGGTPLCKQNMFQVKNSLRPKRFSFGGQLKGALRQSNLPVQVSGREALKIPLPAPQEGQGSEIESLS
jgi:hypothetical protein